MTKQEISELLNNKHQPLFNYLEQHPIDKWEQGPEGKWTTGQQVLHLIQSAQQLNKALGVPKTLLRYKFGKANREPRNYDAIVNRYLERLEGIDGRTFGPSRNMRIPTNSEKKTLVDQLKNEHQKLQKYVVKWKDKSLDNLLLPHPLMGRMVVREIVMWSAFHVEHHTKSLQDNY